MRRAAYGPRFSHREPPGGDVAAYLRRAVGHEVWPYHCRLRLHAPASRIAGRVQGVVTPIDDDSCLLEVASDSLSLVGYAVGALDVDFEVESPPELAEHLLNVARRLARAASATPESLG